MAESDIEGITEVTFSDVRAQGRFETPDGQADIPADMLLAAESYVAQLLHAASQLSEQTSRYLELGDRDQLALGVRHLLLEGLADALEPEAHEDDPDLCYRMN